MALTRRKFIVFAVVAVVLSVMVPLMVVEVPEMDSRAASEV